MVILKRIIIASIFVLIGLGFIFLFTMMYVNVVNDDLYGRMIETKRFCDDSFDVKTDYVTVRFIIHNIHEQENAVDASLLIFTTGQKINHDLKEGKFSITADVRDGYGYAPFGQYHKIVLDSSVVDKNVKTSNLISESENFLFPIANSVDGFPYDDVLIYPRVSVNYSGTPSEKYKLNTEVQKMMTGRQLEVSCKSPRIATLSRTPIEKMFIVSSSVIFLVLAILVGISLILTKTGLSRTEELLAIATYLMATAGFRELIGFSRDTGISALEVAVLGIPLALVFTAIFISFFRGKWKKSNQ
ncbi:hypothetical protein [uncultured Draconibacterium sp.]|uniref:hypothetical protein n=1 Tax=uncultured Draconibacterium sp. TaxID=1573823 RepID=UPI0025FD77ED|nr:hypothetical protein [uncultured Draconibacterium sp.]